VAAVNPEFDDCLKRGRVRRFPGGTELAGQELDQAGEDLSTARGSRAAGNHKWATIQAYYAMFHTARALMKDWIRPPIGVKKKQNILYFILNKL
jgi:hypothetical protein